MALAESDVARAVCRRADTGDGRVERVSGDAVGRWRLRADAFTVLLSFDSATRTIDVWRIVCVR